MNITTLLANPYQENFSNNIANKDLKKLNAACHLQMSGEESGNLNAFNHLHREESESSKESLERLSNVEKVNSSLKNQELREKYYNDALKINELKNKITHFQVSPAKQSKELDEGTFEDLATSTFEEIDHSKPTNELSENEFEIIPREDVLFENLTHKNPPEPFLTLYHTTLDSLMKIDNQITHFQVFDQTN